MMLKVENKRELTKKQRFDRSLKIYVTTIFYIKFIGRAGARPIKRHKSPVYVCRYARFMYVGMWVCM
jgi:hypothetical protein